MFLYKKQKEEFYLLNGEKMSPEFVPPFDQEKGGLDDDGKPVEEVTAEGTVMEVTKETDEPSIQKLDTEANVIAEPTKPEEPMDMAVECAAVKQEEEPDLIAGAVEESVAPSAGGLLPCKVEEVEYQSSNGEKNDGGGGGVLSDVSTTEVAVMPTDSIEFGSVNLNRIHHHSPESTH